MHNRIPGAWYISVGTKEKKGKTSQDQERPSSLPYWRLRAGEVVREIRNERRRGRENSDERTLKKQRVAGEGEALGGEERMEKLRKSRARREGESTEPERNEGRGFHIWRKIIPCALKVLRKSDFFFLLLIPGTWYIWWEKEKKGKTSQEQERPSL